jgi:gluconate 2-dehydrogenase gamma chain
MQTAPDSRRQFLIRSVSGLSASWITLRWPALLAAQRHAHQAAAAAPPPPFQFFSPEQAAEVEAMAAQIIPSDHDPGAREAHAVHFIDRALSTLDRRHQALYIQGLEEVRAKTQAAFPGAQTFSQLTPEQQVRLLTSMEETPFFEVVRVHTIMGFLSNPEYGGNYGQLGWKLIGFEGRPFYQPPFGHYDAAYKNEE